MKTTKKKEVKKYSLLVQKQILVTKEYLNTLNVEISHKNRLLHWFRRLCTHLTKLIVFLTDFHKKEEKKTECKETLLLCLHQLLIILSLLINIFVRESEVNQPLIELRMFCKKQMIWSLNEIEETLFKKSNLEISKANFVSWMDCALEKINQIDYVNKKDQALIVFNKTRVFFEEVLSYAMSIAQVTLQEDYKKIRGSSRSVLEALGSFSTEITKTKPNTAMLNLFKDTCINKLCALERKVNTAVLRLSLKVFSEYILPLEVIHNFCFDKTNIGKQDEFDDLVVDFDLHVDRILQIGLFAMSCSSCTNNCVKIRSCLACLEALETELVPAFTSVLLESNLNNTQLALTLKDHWINQAQDLKKWIYLIIDPSAFCEVSYEENKQLVEELSHTFKVNSVLDRISFDKLMRQSTVLVDFTTVVLEEEDETNKEEIKTALSEFKSVIREVKSAHKILPAENTSYWRIIKRCKILLTSHKTLWGCFVDENSENYDVSNKVNGHGDQKLVGKNSKNGSKCLDHIVARGQQILKDRSILYRTTVKNDTFTLHTRGLNSKNDLNQQQPSLKLAHLRNRTFIHSNNKTNSELQMTDILHELNNLTQVSLGTK